MRLLGIFLFLALCTLVPFLLWGEAYQESFSVDGARSWLIEHGELGVPFAVSLLCSDLVLPVPATAVMSALGIVYGVFLGGLVGAVGSVLAGSLAYGVCRLLGRRAAVRIAGERDLARGERLFASVGGWIVIVSRWLPLLPEVIACMAGLARMPVVPFFAALACGSVPMAFTFAAVGAAGVERPGLALLLSVAIPVALWPPTRLWLRRSKADDPAATRAGSS